ncbi:MAG: hypothetical protein ACRDCW_12850 [Sarcina sp.]
MGFWNKLKSIANMKSIGKAITAGVKAAVGSFLEYGGEKLNLVGLELKGANMQREFDEIAKEIGEKSAFNIDDTQTEEVESINEVLTTFVVGLEKKTNEFEERMCEYILESHTTLIRVLEESEDVDIDTAFIKKEKEKFEKSTRNYLKNYISKRASIDNKECLKILGLPKGDIKIVSMKIFENNILYEGRLEYTRYLIDELNKFESIFIYVLENKYEDLTNMIEEYEKTLNDITSSDEKLIEKEHKDLLKMTNLCDEALEICSI